MGFLQVFVKWWLPIPNFSLQELYNGKHKIYHVKPLKVLTPESVAEMKHEDDVLHHQNNVQDIPVPQALSVHYEQGEFREVDK